MKYVFWGAMHKIVRRNSLQIFLKFYIEKKNVFYDGLLRLEKLHFLSLL